MDGIDLLRREALIKRNAAILKAKRDYYAALKEINKLRGKLGIRQPGRPCKVEVFEDPTLKAAAVARAILLEGKRLTLRELTLEVQRRGCRPRDDYRAVSHAIHAGLGRYRRQLRRDDQGRWCLR